MRATLTVAVHGRSVRHLEVNPPLCARVVHRSDTSGPLTEVWLVSSGASLLEGDELTVRLELSGGARVAVRSVAAAVVHPCPGGGWAGWNVHAHIGDRAQLLWWPEPTVVAGGAWYVARSELALGADATLAWADEMVLGRSGERPDQVRLDTAVRVDRDGAPVLRDGLRSQPGWTAAAVTGGARYLGTRCLVGPAGPVGPAAAFPLAPSRDPHPTVARPDGALTGGNDGWMALAATGCWSRRVVAADPLAGRCQLSAPGGGFLGRV